MSAPIQVPIVREMRECERCGVEVDDGLLMLVRHPESYGIAHSPDTFELVCPACLKREADELPF